MKDLKVLIDNKAVDTELLNAILRAKKFLMYEPEAGQTGQNMAGSLRVGTKLFADYLGVDTDINAVGRLGTGLNGNGNSPLQFNVNNGINGALFYDNHDTEVRNALKMDMTTAEEGYIILHSGNVSHGIKEGLSIDVNTVNPDWRNIITLSETNIIPSSHYEIVINVEYNTDIAKKIPLARYSLDGGTNWKSLTIPPSEFKDNVTYSFVLPYVKTDDKMNFKLDMTRVDSSYSLHIDRATFSYKKIG